MEFQIKPKTHRVGNFYEFEDCTYILAQVSSLRCAMVVVNGFDTGNRYNDPVKVSKVHEITESEFRAITYGDNFKKVNSPF
jgi:hypothetical protein